MCVCVFQVLSDRVFSSRLESQGVRTFSPHLSPDNYASSTSSFTDHNREGGDPPKR